VSFWQLSFVVLAAAAAVVLCSGGGQHQWCSAAGWYSAVPSALMWNVVIIHCILVSQYQLDKLYLDGYEK